MARTRKNVSLGGIGMRPAHNSIPTNSVEIAISRIANMVEDEKISSPTRLAAARTILEIAGLIGAGRDKSRQDKAPEEMSTADLQRMIAAIQGELADRAKPVDVPDNSLSTSQLLDSIE